jgi:hypothetical protein
MQPGVYEQLLSKGLHQVLSGLPGRGLVASLADVEAAERAGVLSEHFARVLRSALASAYSKDDPERQLRFYNSLVGHLTSLTSAEDVSGAIAEPPARQLRLVWPEGRPAPARPDSPLAVGTLLTGTRLDPSLISELRKELETADAVDILVSFIKWGGVRVLEDELRSFTARPGAVLRVITTSYLGATDLKAVEFLRNLPNTSVLS